ncbi:hypothetical protein llap_4438 [Limosa lapponica baueri]|uniref:Uncharacterized protein n=1 Tax=Limosa lapponica baueri TaxID=1758121 RepID=A0A2I0UGV6_LIMLA|nr:hypothetical protein llap_4438 [Limosa lapponica baueri]
MLRSEQQPVDAKIRSLWVNIILPDTGAAKDAVRHSESQQDRVYRAGSHLCLEKRWSGCLHGVYGDDNCLNPSDPIPPQSFDYSCNK